MDKADRTATSKLLELTDKRPAEMLTLVEEIEQLKAQVGKLCDGIAVMDKFCIKPTPNFPASKRRVNSVIEYAQKIREQCKPT